MKLSSTRRPFVGSAVASLLLLLPAGLWAQGAGRAQIEKPVFDDLPSPEINVGKNKSFKPKDWLEVEAKVRLAKARADEVFADQVLAKWYVAVKNPDGKGLFLLTKDVNHINVPVEEDI